MPTASRLNLRKQLAQRLYGADSFLTGAATAAGSTTTLVDSGLISTMLGANELIGYWLYIDSLAADAAPEGQARQVVSYAPSTGTLTVDPAFTAAPTSVSAATYELHPKLHPDRLTEAINWALQFGSHNAYPSITDDDLTTSAIYDKEILLEGGLYYVKQAMAREKGLPDEVIVDLTKQWQAHYERWTRGLADFENYQFPQLVTREG